MDERHQTQIINLFQIAVKMKILKISSLIVIALLLAQVIQAQVINWSNLQENNRHMINGYVGADYGIVYGLGYGYYLKGNLFPIVVNIEWSQPMGEKLLDDFKIKPGVQIRWFELGNIQFSTRLYGVIRRYESELVRMVNFGSDLSGTIGYYRPGWFIGAEVGFDKAIITHLKHSALYKESYPSVKDGWYGPATGGNFYYGIQTGFSLKRHEIFLSAGKVLTQDFKTTPLLPYYAKIGCNWKLY